MNYDVYKYKNSISSKKVKKGVELPKAPLVYATKNCDLLPTFLSYVR